MINVNDFIGLTKKSSQDLAESKNIIYRLISLNGEEYFSMPEDKRDDRICVFIENGKVVKAVIN